MTASASRRLSALSLPSTAFSSATSSAASARRVLPATPRGRTEASRALACSTDRCRGAPAGTSSASSRCSRFSVRFRLRDSSSRRSANSRSTVRSSSATSLRSPRVRSATTAIECASVASVLRPWPVSNTRTRAASFAGTSTTVSPSANSRAASGRPPRWRPPPPTPAPATAAQTPAAAGNRPCPSETGRWPAGSRSSRTSIVADRLCGSVPMITRPITPPRPVRRPVLSTGRAALLRAEQTPLGPHPASGARQDRTPEESHTNPRWAAA